MTPIAKETLDYLRITNKAFGDKNLVFTLMTNVLSNLPEFVRNEIIGEFLAIPAGGATLSPLDERLLAFRTKTNRTIEATIGLNADGKAITTEFDTRPADLDTVIQISLPKDIGRDGTPFNITRLDALKDALGLSAFKGNKVLNHLASNPGTAIYSQYVRGADLQRIVEQLIAVGFLVR